MAMNAFKIMSEFPGLSKIMSIIRNIEMTIDTMTVIMVNTTR